MLPEQDHRERLIRVESTMEFQTAKLDQLDAAVEKLLETSRYQAHAVDVLLENSKSNKYLDERLRNLEDALSKAQFLWKIAFGIVSTPSVVAILYFGFKWLNAMNGGAA